MMRGERCLKIAAVIDPTDADTWPTLKPEWLNEEDEFWRAGFVEGALEIRRSRRIDQTKPALQRIPACADRRIPRGRSS
jgi:hypothetical protein